LRREILERAGDVARASGGLLGFGEKVSPAEQAVLAKLEHAFGWPPVGTTSPKGPAAGLFIHSLLT
jgi:hypothetical protein